MENIYHLTYIHQGKTTTIQEKEGVPFITFPKLSAFDADLLHGFSTRLGGVSEKHLYSMNLSFSRGDDAAKVFENHKRFAKALGYDETRLVFSNQVHGTRFYQVTRQDAGKGITRESDIKEVDGLVTDIPGIPLITFYADCVPLFFYDKKRKVIAMAHSGWRGTVKRIGAKMITCMKENYGSAPEDIICAVAPSICQACYEVSEDVAGEFLSAFGEKCDTAMLYAKGSGKYQLNLHRACEITLLEAGIRPDHLDITDLCTCCNPDFFYSHRASGGMRGNLAGIIMLKGSV